jgi:hypothetical protein
VVLLYPLRGVRVKGGRVGEGEGSTKERRGEEIYLARTKASTNSSSISIKNWIMSRSKNHLNVVNPTAVAIVNGKQEDESE